MARPLKQGVDYFSLDVHIDNKLKFIKAKFKWEGYGIIIGMFQHIYSQGYWCSWSDDDMFLYSDENKIDYELLQDITKEALNRKLFNQEVYAEHQVLTSSGIQKRYSEIVQRRVNVSVVPEYKVIEGEWGKQSVVKDASSSKHDVGNMSAECKHDVGKSTQTKLKGKETKDKLNEEEPTTEKCNPIFEQMRKSLNMSDVEINAVYTTCSDPGRMAEAVQCAVEFDLFLRNKEQKALDNPVTYIKMRYKDGKQSSKTRFNKGGNKPEVNPNLKTKEEVLEILTKAIEQPAENDMWEFLKEKDTKLYYVTDHNCPNLFTQKQGDFGIIYKIYSEIKAK